MRRVHRQILVAVVLLVVSQLIAAWFCFVSGAAFGTADAAAWYGGSFLLYLCTIAPAWGSIK